MSNEAKHTPGPWTKVAGFVTGANGKHVAQVPAGPNGGRPSEPYVDSVPIAEANAHLIKAAPEMYEALEELSDAFAFLDPSNSSGWKRRALEKARAALQKAKGES